MKTEKTYWKVETGEEFNSSTIIQYYDEGMRFGKFLRANDKYAWIKILDKEIKIPIDKLEMYLPEKRKEEF
jgi:hypothetical protein